MSRLKNFQEFTLATSMAASTTNAAETIYVGSGEGANFPDVDGWKAVIWAQSRLRPDLDPNREIVSIYASNSSLDWISILRGQEGTTAGAHGTAGETYKLSLILTASDIEVRTPQITPQDFGAAGDGTTDDATPFKRALNYAIENDGDLYIPPSTIKIATQVTLPALLGSVNLKIHGAGQGSVISAQLTDGTPIFDFDRDDLAIQELKLCLRDFLIKQDSTNWDGYIWRVDKGTNIIIDNVEYNGNSKGHQGLFDLSNCFQVKFLNCHFRCAGGYNTVRLVNDGINGGEANFSGVNFFNAFCAIWVSGTSTAQEINLYGSKITSPRDRGGWSVMGTGGSTPGGGNADLSTWTAAATEIDIGDGNAGGGWSFDGNQTPMVLIDPTNTLNPELVFIDDYGADAGFSSGYKATLWNAGLAQNWSGNSTVWVVTGGMLIATGRYTKAVNLHGCHLEGGSACFADVYNATVRGCGLSTLDYATQIGDSNTQGRVFVGGPHSTVEIFSNHYAMDYTSLGHKYCVQSVGDRGGYLTGWNKRIHSGSDSNPGISSEMVDDVVGGVTTAVVKKVTYATGSL